MICANCGHDRSAHYHYVDPDESHEWFCRTDMWGPGYAYECPCPEFVDR